MRYKEDEIPPEMLAVNASNDMLLFTAVLGLLIGILMFVAGRYGRQMWIWTWGAALVIFSIYLWIAINFDIRLVGIF